MKPGLSRALILITAVSAGVLLALVPGNDLRDKLGSTLVGARPAVPRAGFGTDRPGTGHWNVFGHRFAGQAIARRICDGLGGVRVAAQP